MRRILLSLFVGIFVVSSVHAQPLADHVPANALIYFGWRGTDDLGPAYNDSHLKAIVDQSNYRAVIDQMFPAAMARITQFNPQAAPVIQTIKSIAAPMYRHPTAIFLGDVNIEQRHGRDADVKVKAGVLCQAGSDAPQMLGELQKLVDQMPHDPSFVIRAAQDGDVVELTLNYAEGELPNPSTGQSLAKDSAYTTAVSNVQKDPVISVYMNFERSFEIADAAFALSDDPQVKSYWPKIRDASGLLGLKRFMITGAFDGQDWMEQAFAEAPAPRKGLLSLMDTKPIDMQMLKGVPDNANLVLAGSFNLNQLINVVHDGVTQVDTDAGLKMTQGLGLVSMYIGRDFQKDVLAPLGEHWVAYTSPTIAGRGGLGAVMINDVNDPAKASSGLFTVQAAAFNTLRGYLPKYISLRCNTIKSGDLSITYFAVPLITPAWAVQGKSMYVGLYPQSVISAARFGASNGKSITDNENFNVVRKRLAAPDNLTGFSYMDFTQTAGDGYQTLLALSRLVLGAGDIFGVQSPEPVVPTLDVILPHIKPGGSISYVDDAGWHSRGVVAFPGMELLGTDNSSFMQIIPQLSQSIAVLLPSLSRARMQAQNANDVSRLRQIGMACIMFSNDHAGRLPQSLGDTAKYNGNNANIYLRSDHADAAAAALGLPPDQLKDWIDQNSDWVYLGNGQRLTQIQNAAQSVLAYQKGDAPASGQLPVLFVDGHVQEMTQNALQQTLMKQ